MADYTEHPACKNCGSQEYKYTDSRRSCWESIIRRRRAECLECGHRFTTVEVPVECDFRELTARLAAKTLSEYTSAELLEELLLRDKKEGQSC